MSNVHKALYSVPKRRSLTVNQFALLKVWAECRLVDHNRTWDSPWRTSAWMASRTMTLPSIRQHMQSNNREDASGCQRCSCDQ